MRQRRVTQIFMIFSQIICHNQTLSLKSLLESVASYLSCPDNALEHNNELDIRNIALLLTNPSLSLYRAHESCNLLSRDNPCTLVLDINLTAFLYLTADKTQNQLPINTALSISDSQKYTVSDSLPLSFSSRENYESNLSNAIDSYSSSYIPYYTENTASLDFSNELSYTTSREDLTFSRYDSPYDSVNTFSSIQTIDDYTVKSQTFSITLTSMASELTVIFEISSYSTMNLDPISNESSQIVDLTQVKNITSSGALSQESNESSNYFNENLTSVTSNESLSYKQQIETVTEEYSNDQKTESDINESIIDGTVFTSDVIANTVRTTTESELKNLSTDYSYLSSIDSYITNLPDNQVDSFESSILKSTLTVNTTINTDSLNRSIEDSSDLSIRTLTVSVSDISYTLEDNLQSNYSNISLEKNNNSSLEETFSNKDELQTSNGIDLTTTASSVKEEPTQDFSFIVSTESIIEYLSTSVVSLNTNDTKVFEKFSNTETLYGSTLYSTEIPESDSIVKAAISSLNTANNVTITYVISFTSYVTSTITFTSVLSEVNSISTYIQGQNSLTSLNSIKQSEVFNVLDPTMLDDNAFHSIASSTNTSQQYYEIGVNENTVASQENYYETVESYSNKYELFYLSVVPIFHSYRSSIFSSSFNNLKYKPESNQVFYKTMAATVPMNSNFELTRLISEQLYKYESTNTCLNSINYSILNYKNSSSMCFTYYNLYQSSLAYSQSKYNRLESILDTIEILANKTSIEIILNNTLSYTSIYFTTPSTLFTCALKDWLILESGSLTKEKYLTTTIMLDLTKTLNICRTEILQKRMSIEWLSKYRLTVYNAVEAIQKSFNLSYSCNLLSLSRSMELHSSSSTTHKTKNSCDTIDSREYNSLNYSYLIPDSNVTSHRNDLEANIKPEPYTNFHSIYSKKHFLF